MKQNDGIDKYHQILLRKKYYIKSDGIDQYHQILYSESYEAKSDGIGQYHQILWSKIFYLVKSDGIEKYQTCENIYFFFILQCQWHQHGSEVLENTLLILRG